MHLSLQPSEKDGYNGYTQDYAPYAFLPLLTRKFRNIGKATVLFALLFGLCTVGHAGEWNLLVNGKAMHAKDRSSTPYNEKNWGAGAQYDFGDINSRWNKFVTVSGFLDSNKDASYYIGGGNARRFMLSEKMDFLHLDVGLVGFVMTRKDHHSGRPFIGVLPMLSIGTKDIAINITYIPEVSPKMVEIWFFQLKVSERKFW